MSLSNEIPNALEAGTHAGNSARARTDEDQLREFMVRYQQGDAAAVEELVSRLSPALLRFCSRPGTSRGDAEDLLQDCWMRIHRARHTYSSSEPLLPWIYAIARHTRVDAYRRRRRLETREVLVAETPEQAQAAPATNVENTNVMNLVDRLPESQREVVLMLKVEGMSLEEVAGATSSTPGAIKQKAHRAYAALRRMLEE